MILISLHYDIIQVKVFAKLIPETMKSKQSLFIGILAK